MSFKHIFVIFVFIAFSKTNSDAIDDAQTQIENVISLLGDDIAESINKFDALATEHDATANAKSRELIDSLISQIETADKNDCVNQKKENLEIQAEENIQEIVTCELDIIKESRSILEHIQNQIQTGITHINREMEEVKICDYLNLPKRDVCVNITSTVLSKKVSSVEKRVGSDVAAGMTKMETLKIKWEECTTSKMYKVTEFEDQIVECLIMRKI